METKNVADEVLPELSFSDEAQLENAMSAPTFSRNRLIDEFEQSGNITTVALRETILIEPDDDELGVKRFEELFTIFLDKAEQNSIEPTFIWAAVRSTSLVSVVRPLRANNPKLFDWLLTHASFADLSLAGAMMFSILNELAEPARNERLTLTASRSAHIGSSFEYDIHFQPNAERGRWPNGPLCEPLTNPPMWLDDFVRLLHKCHNILVSEKADAEKNMAFQALNELNVSMMPLRNLVGAV